VAAWDGTRGREWEKSGPPLVEDLPEAGEELNESGEDQDVQGRGHPVPGGVAVSLRTHVGQEAGKRLSRERGGVKHVSYLS